MENSRSCSRVVPVEWLWEKAYCSRLKQKIGNEVETTVCRRSLLMTERREIGWGEHNWEIPSLVSFSPEMGCSGAEAYERKH